MGAILRTLARTGVRRGLAPTGSGFWLTIGLAAGALQFRRRRGEEPKVQLCEELEPGQTMVITHYPKGTRRF